MTISTSDILRALGLQSSSPHPHSPFNNRCPTPACVPPGGAGTRPGSSVASWFWFSCPFLLPAHPTTPTFTCPAPPYYGVMPLPTPPHPACHPPPPACPTPTRLPTLLPCGGRAPTHLALALRHPHAPAPPHTPPRLPHTYTTTWCFCCGGHCACLQFPCRFRCHKPMPNPAITLTPGACPAGSHAAYRTTTTTAAIYRAITTYPTATLLRAHT